MHLKDVMEYLYAKYDSSEYVDSAFQWVNKILVSANSAITGIIFLPKWGSDTDESQIQISFIQGRLPDLPYEDIKEMYIYKFAGSVLYKQEYGRETQLTNYQYDLFDNAIQSNIIPMFAPKLPQIA